MTETKTTRLQVNHQPFTDVSGDQSVLDTMLQVTKHRERLCTSDDGWVNIAWEMINIANGSKAESPDENQQSTAKRNAA